MSAAAISSRSGRRLTAKGRARRAAARRRRMFVTAAAACVVVIGAPLSIAGYMGVESSIAGVAAAKSFFAMMADRSPGARTKAELTKTKHRPATPPMQRALGKITKPEPPKEFVEALAPPPPKLGEAPLALAPVTSLGPMLITPQTPGGIAISPQSPPGGGGGPTPQPPGVEPPPTEPPPTEPPPTEPPPTPPVVPEPGTWATMLLGFGLTGWVLRRRRRKTALPQLA